MLWSFEWYVHNIHATVYLTLTRCRFVFYDLTIDMRCSTRRLSTFVIRQNSRNQENSCQRSFVTDRYNHYLCAHWRWVQITGQLLRCRQLGLLFLDCTDILRRAQSRYANIFSGARCGNFENQGATTGKAIQDVDYHAAYILCCTFDHRSLRTLLTLLALRLPFSLFACPSLQRRCRLQLFSLLC